MRLLQGSAPSSGKHLRAASALERLVAGKHFNFTATGDFGLQQERARPSPYPKCWKISSPWWHVVARRSGPLLALKSVEHHDSSAPA